MTILDEGVVNINNESDIILARKIAREMSGDLKFTLTDITRIVTSVSELARNIFLYAGKGVMTWSKVRNGGKSGIKIKFEDNGPGIKDIDQAMVVGFTSSRGLGMGLPGAKKLMDDFEILSEFGVGTTITIYKWLK